MLLTYLKPYKYLILILFALSMPAYFPYIPRTIQYSSCGLLLIFGILLGNKKGIILTGLWSIIILVLSHFFMISNYFFHPILEIVILLLFSISVGYLLDYKSRVQEELRDKNEELKNKNVELKETKEKLNKQMEKARQIHSQFLPDELPRLDQISAASYYQAAQEIGGDFYNLIKFRGKLIGYIVDITGHGLDGALLNIFIRERINNFLADHCADRNILSPAEMLTYLAKEYYREGFPEDYFVCISIFVIWPDRGKLIYTNAGNHIPGFLADEEEVKRVMVEELPLSTAIKLDKYNFREVELKFKEGNGFLLTTDGLIENSRDDKNCSLDEFEKVLEENKELSPEAVIETVKVNFKLDSKEEGEDDITLLVVKYN